MLKDQKILSGVSVGYDVISLGYGSYSLKFLPEVCALDFYVMQNKPNTGKQGKKRRDFTEREVRLRSWSCSHINCEIPSSNPIGPTPPLQLSISRLHNPDKLSPSLSSLEKYIHK